MRLIWACLIALLLTEAAFCQKKTLDPPPVPPLPAPATEPPPIIPSSIKLPVSSNVPDPKIVDDEVCEFYKGHVTHVEIFPPMGAEADFEIWRKPLGISFSGNTLTASMDTYYWILGQFTPLGIPIFGQCGAQGPTPPYGDEITREVIVTIDSRVKWHRDWHIDTDTTVRPFNNINQCIVTAANKNITEHFNRAGERFLRTAAGKFDERIAELSNAQPRAAEMWSKLQEPLRIGDRVWLLLQPTAAGAGEINVTNTQPQVAQTAFELAAQPKIVLGEQPSSGTTPLPPLQPLTPGPDGIHIITDVELPFDEANRIIQDPRTGVVGATFQSGRRELKIVGARIYGSASKVAVELSVEGRAIRDNEPQVVDVVTAIVKAFKRVRYFFEKRLYKLKGKIYLTGTPQYLTDRREIVFPDLEYDLETRNVIARIANWILRTRLTERLRADVKFPLGDRLDSLKNNASAALNRALGTHATLTGRVDSLRVERVYVGNSAFKGRVALDGSAELSVNWR